MNYTIKLFLKFGSLENITDLYENGTIYMNTIEYFRKNEDEFLRGDNYEGASRVINSLPGSMNIPGIEVDLKYEKVHIKEAYEEILGNLYCLYCVSNYGFPNLLELKIDERNLRFGSHVLIIKDNLYFFKTIIDSLKRKGYKFHHGFVNYYDKETISKELSVFEKPSEFEYQKEFRFYVENDKIEPIKIQIGSLRKYSEIFDINEILNIKTEIRKSF